jgi:hypothetical protein
MSATQPATDAKGFSPYPETSVTPLSDSPADAIPYRQDTDDTGLVRSTTDPIVVWRHRGWATLRARTRRALAAAPIRPRALQEYDLCGANAWLVRDATDHTRTRILTSTCRSRWCLPCARARAYVIATNIEQHLADAPARKIELTLRSTDAPLSDQMTRLWACFRLLRATRLWRDRVSGGAAVLETTISPATGLWHPHLHVVYHGRYIAHSQLSAEWERITGDSPVVWIRFVGDARAVASYVSKYVVKPTPSPNSLTDAQLAEMIRAYAHRRLVTTIGDWRGIRLCAPLDSTVWEPWCPMVDLCERLLEGSTPHVLAARALDAHSLDLLAAHLHSRDPTASLPLLLGL